VRVPVDQRDRAMVNEAVRREPARIWLAIEWLEKVQGLRMVK
jgi:hypothetical protein